MTNTYDQVRYPGMAFPQTHPDRLATIAILHGMEPAPVDACRVLELGCGIGGNLIPMANQLPDSVFVGLDLSESAIQHGRQIVAALGMKNVELRCGDIMEVGPDEGQFDYIIAHGVYSWVPPFVREKIFSILKHNLAPAGVAYLSYNCYPGAHLRNIARDLMVYHVRGIDDSREQIQQARAAMKFLHEANVEHETYRAVVCEQFERVSKTPDEVLFHDDLEEVSVPFYLHEVVEAARRHGLQYMSETDYSYADLRDWPEEVARVLRNIPDEEVVAREQYLDFVRCRAFRQTLLCREHIKLRRSVDSEVIKRFYLATPVLPANNGPVDPAAEETVEFRRDKKGTMSINSPMVKAAILALSERWPEDVGFAELVQLSRDKLGEDFFADAEKLETEVDTLAEALFRAFV
ncbi:MAG TPA: methyltransferase domain-containing protein, partial [Pyrinomonadaceae bacterium]|nr:methyltransferase domain-containing protein [Pyrinomonadaceae bacterium]